MAPRITSSATVWGAMSRVRHFSALWETNQYRLVTATTIKDVLIFRAQKKCDMNSGIRPSSLVTILKNSITDNGNIK